MTLNRRDFLKFSAGAASAVGLSTLTGCAGTGPAVGGARPKVVVVGAGFGGATCAKYLKLWDPNIEVTLIEANEKFVSCPLSNLVIGGARTIDDLTFSYDGLKKLVDNFVHDTVVGIDATARTLRTASGRNFSYDRLVLSGGIELQYDKIEGYDAEARKTVMHGWKAGPQTVTLRRQLEAMPDGGVFVLATPPTPYRCPPGPYERACLVADYFKQHKPRSKVIVLDASSDIVSKKGLFMAAWKKHYGFGTPNSLIDYRPSSKALKVNAATKTISLEFDDIKGDVINVIPPMRAAKLTELVGARPAEGKQAWCPVDFRSYESKTVPNVHILGDSAESNMPKAGAVANNTGKMCAAALVELLNGRPLVIAPVITNTCFSATSGTTAMHVAMVFRADKDHMMVSQPLPDKGISKEESEAEMKFMDSWGKNIWADTLNLKV